MYFSPYELIFFVPVCSLQVLCIGPTGTGKTLTISDKLLKNMPAEFITHFLMFSARTSANQTQDCIDSKLDKRYKVSPALQSKFFIFIFIFIFVLFLRLS